jgi:hypothetical protein
LVKFAPSILRGYLSFAAGSAMNLIALLVELLCSCFGKQWRWRLAPASTSLRTHGCRALRDEPLEPLDDEADARAARWMLGERWLTGNRSSSDAVDGGGLLEPSDRHFWQTRRSWSG